MKKKKKYLPSSSSSEESSSSSSTELETQSSHKVVVKKCKQSHSRDWHVSKHKKVKHALAVELENSSSDSEGSED